MRIDAALGGKDLRRVGGVEDDELGGALGVAERPLKDLRRERRAAHAKQNCVLVAAPADFFGEALELGDAVEHLAVDRQPAKAVDDLALNVGIVCPEGRVFAEKPVEQLLAVGWHRLASVSLQ